MSDIKLLKNKTRSPMTTKTMNSKRAESIGRMQRKSKGTVAATSPMAMGKALVLLATSCAALSTGGGNAMTGRRAASHPPPRAAHGHCSRPGRHADAGHCGVALRYRDGDEDQPLDMQAANQSAVESAVSADRAAVSTSGRSGVATPTRHLVSRPKLLFTPIVRLMPTMPPMPQYTPSSPPTKEEEEQLVMDEYLEYVERRYTRMHLGDQRPRPRVVLDLGLPRKIFFATLALHRPSPASLADGAGQIEQSPPPSDHSVATAYGRAAARAREPRPSDSEDALRALGLTDLASARLRQRLHVPRDLRDEHTLLAAGTSTAVNFFNHMVHLNDLNAKSLSAAAAADAAAQSSSSTPSSALASASSGGRT